MPVSSAISSGRWSAASTRKMSRSRSGEGSRSASCSASSSSGAAGSGSVSPPVSSARQPFSRASGNVRPIAITSPTDFMRVPSRRSVARNFSNAQRGILTTQ